MHAIVIRKPGGPEALEWAEVPDPEPGPGEVLIEVAASAVNRADVLQHRLAGDATAGRQTVEGTVDDTHPAGDDLYINHDYNDIDIDVAPDAAHADLAATGNGGHELGLHRPMLHAWRLRLRHPRTGKEMSFEAPPPLDFESFWSTVV